MPYNKIMLFTILAIGGGSVYHFLNQPGSNQPVLIQTDTTQHITTSQLLQATHKKSSQQLTLKNTEEKYFSLSYDAKIDKKAQQVIAETDALIKEKGLDISNLHLQDDTTTKKEQLRQIEILLSEAENELASIN